MILKIDNAAVAKDAKITQVIENPLRYFLDGEMDFSCVGTMRASWKQTGTVANDPFAFIRNMPAR